MQAFVAIVAIVISVPIIAIISQTLIRLSYNKKGKGSISSADKNRISMLEKKLGQMQEENQLLHERLKNVETIVSETDWALLLASRSDEDEDIKKIKELNKILPKK